MRQLIFAVTTAAALIAPVGLHAQPWLPGSEIVGQTLEVQTNGTVNRVTLNGDGTATIATPNGQIANATWSAANNMLCLSTGGPQECWPYTQAFQAGRAMPLTSNCQSVSTWTAQMVNEAPAADTRGERG